MGSLELHEVGKAGANLEEAHAVKLQMQQRWSLVGLGLNLQSHDLDHWRVKRLQKKKKNKIKDFKKFHNLKK